MCRVNNFKFMGTAKTNIRSPGVAGMFYPASGDRLTSLIERLSLQANTEKSTDTFSGNIIGGIVPHAGMVYCGRQTAGFFEEVNRSGFAPDTVIIVHPNHYGAGPRFSIDAHHYWELPNGIIETDMELGSELDLPFSSSAQEREHSAEVIVPFILHYFPGTVKLVSLNMLDQSYQACCEVAGKILSAAKNQNRNIMLIASSDFSHFVSRTEAREMDDIVLKEIIARNTLQVYRTIMVNNISVCGYGPIMTLMEYCSGIDPEYGIKLLSRGDSGNIRDTSDVVSYVSALFYS